MKSQGKISYRVPDEYFSRLEERLSHIPEKYATRTRAAYPAFVRYVAVAAVVALFTVAGMTLYRMDESGEPLSAEELWMSDLVPITDPYMVYGEYIDGSDDSSGMSVEHLTSYIIDSGTSLEAIEYYENLK